VSWGKLCLWLVMRRACLGCALQVSSVSALADWGGHFATLCMVVTMLGLRYEGCVVSMVLRQVDLCLGSLVVRRLYLESLLEKAGAWAYLL
jgi:hypothetical protein